jgi:transcription initiation factor TFIIH subunit 1
MSRKSHRMSADRVSTTVTTQLRPMAASTYQNVLWKQGGKNLSCELCLNSHELQFMDTIVPWHSVAKHQVSPASYPKPLLKLVLVSVLNGSNNVTFQLASRESLEAIRKDITVRLQLFHKDGSVKKRPLAGSWVALPMDTANKQRKMDSGRFSDLDPDALAVTRSTLLASNPHLRQQYESLVLKGGSDNGGNDAVVLLSEADFWTTHAAIVEEEYAKIVGISRAGTPSFLRSYIPTTGKVTLGVEEMRQIFVLYPAVHKAYEEKVPLELSGTYIHPEGLCCR